MTEQALFKSSAGWLEAMVSALSSSGTTVVAPVEDDGVLTFRVTTTADAIITKPGTTPLSIKDLFLPKSEVLLEFGRRKDGNLHLQSTIDTPPDDVVLLGSRPCDAASLAELDAVYQWDYDDTFYRTRRERTTIVTFACTEAPSSCFCTSVEGSPHNTAESDVLIFAGEGGSAIAQVITDKGKALIERLETVFRPASADTKLPEAPTLDKQFYPENIKRWLDNNFESDFWRDASLRCVACGTCSYLCPSCHCFDIVDEATWNRGRRIRNWDCCSFALFTLHASSHNPRDNQAARYRQRVMHKFKYIPDRFGLLGCVGCGRCVDHCGVGHNILRVLLGIERRFEKDNAETKG